jgi:hypothetical protein
MQEYVYLYIKKFTWLDTETASQTDGHPLPNRVYRAIKTNNIHSIIVEGKSQLVLPGLICEEDIKGYNCEIVEISLRNIVDLLPNEEDLKSMEKWMEIKNSDIVPPTEIPSELMDKLQRALAQQAVIQQTVLEDADTLNHLNILNSIQYEAVLELIDYLIELNIGETDESGNFTAVSGLSRGSQGLGYNIGQALQNIELYTNSEHTVRANDQIDSPFRDYLMEATVALIKESERRKIQELD